MFKGKVSAIGLLAGILGVGGVMLLASCALFIDDGVVMAIVDTWDVNGEVKYKKE